MSEIMNNITGHKNVCTEVVGKNLCIGCGICASICPSENLKIEFNRFGEYNALEIGNSCGEKCNLCLKVCPFYNNKDNEDTLGQKLFAETPGIKHTPETGYYLDAFVGYSNVKSHRENGASGGLATWTSEKLLADNLIDHVACVSPNDDPEKLFKFKICNTPKEVRECSRSCYYPVETSEVIRHILQNEGRYAIIGLPCVCKAIRLAMQSIPKLQGRIKFVLGLVCGQTKSKFFAEYVCGLGGGDPHCLKQVTFRIKDPNRPASNFGMKFVSENGMNPRREGVVFWTDGMNRIWFDRYFTPNACNFCDDIFAECADVTFMDAWLPEYSADWRGHSIVLLRNENLSEILAAGAEKCLEISGLGIEDIIKSQQGVLDAKRKDLKTRLEIASAKGEPVPNTRLELIRRSFEICKERLVKACFDISQESGKAWTEADKDIQIFNRMMSDLQQEINTAKRKSEYFRIPNAIIRRLIKKVCG